MIHKKPRLRLDYPSPQRLLILGCGDVGLRLIRWLRQVHRPEGLQIIATARRHEQALAIREAGATPILIDLDHQTAVKRLASLASWLIVLLPPSERLSDQDLRIKRLVAQWRAGTSDIASAASSVQRRGHTTIKKLIYVSTTGVFGDWQGAWIDETVTPRPKQARSLRRLHAEQQLLQAFHAVRLRVPGIYAEDRLPTDRIRQGKPCLEPQEDSYSNHIHADDLAIMLWLSLFRAAPGRLYAIVDNEPLAMGDWFDHIARLHGLPPPPRAPRETVSSAVSPMMWSFMQESRRIHNRRMHEEIRPRLKAPRARIFLEQMMSHREQTAGKQEPKQI